MVLKKFKGQVRKIDRVNLFAEIANKAKHKSKLFASLSDSGLRRDQLWSSSQAVNHKIFKMSMN